MTVAKVPKTILDLIRIDISRYQPVLIYKSLRLSDTLSISRTLVVTDIE
jgi:hypothetical protein